MTITRITDTTEIKQGHWVCKTSMLHDGICSNPRQVVKVSGQRLYVTNRHGEDEGEYIARRTVLYLCDTRAEGEALKAVSDAQDEAIRAGTKAIKQAHRAQIDALIAGVAP